MRENWMWRSTGDFEGWEVTRKLSDGSTAAFGANEFLAADSRTIQWNIEIEVFRKRKNRSVSSGEYTGPGGLEAAGFFLEALSDFERFYASPGDRIQVSGYDGRRHRAYQKVLEKRGYWPTRFEGHPYLVKIIEKR